ncbi:hypothetical protein [Tenacibaculum maritimum]|uniref:hypothetical protein n=1 Tax=Tenacibaculum maritimum TaxID=107401 RepID=UPI001E29FAF4|nr:hypothetical protein [Tenacibaculum maritimum]MCD9621882.1 hypothetical protein [Tenacibaculum maritimum]MCD9628252.1 hypothetical protein [Tenacibaculum maritimum]MCD9631074.1 hypothetical protein [Tenacibaculum maritimum]MCD9634056.1 hypothetical protein [Tenacibaculum maritimum]
MKAKEPILKAYEQSPHFNLSNKEIGTYIDELYMPYTLTFKKNDEYLNYRKKLPRYSYPDKRTGAGETGRIVDGIIYVIPEPKETETKKIEKFIQIEGKRKKLVEIKQLQVQLFSKETERKGLDCYNEIKNRIEILFKDVLDIDKLQEEISIEVENLKEKQGASNKGGNPHPRFFTSLRGFKIFERFKGTIQNPLADYSFIYRMMLKDNLIYESIGDSEYRRWLSSEYDIEIDKTKQLGRCSTFSKEQLYSSIKSDIK